MYKFWRMIEHRGPGLKSLGVQHRYDVTLFSHWNGQLSRLLSKCRNAEHLRLPLSIDAIRSNAWEAHEDEDEDGEEDEDEDGEEDEDEGGEEDEDEDEWEDEDEEEDEDEGEEDEDPFKDEDVEEFMASRVLSRTITT
ncbi:uncharacterized protein J4E92_009555 [Alternaria infectoria]|uniref:uncharacterized protein n=1 Tax=Alternaria infectoria TaxID=45303 RepID=UPI0022204F05|nr:uncharacterized protein J4E92_009555 [Alternaria infectoria]KAI4914356.1 hypothetical protein J4E92_009555 [Alternaria infectoria]